MTDIHFLRERSRRATAGFLRADLDLACTFCELAKRSQHLELFTARLQNAKRALDTALNLLWKANLEPRELDELTTEIERLKFELESLETEVLLDQSLGLPPSNA